MIEDNATPDGIIEVLSEEETPLASQVRKSIAQLAPEEQERADEIITAEQVYACVCGKCNLMVSVHDGSGNGYGPRCHRKAIRALLRIFRAVEEPGGVITPLCPDCYRLLRPQGESQ